MSEAGKRTYASNTLYIQSHLPGIRCKLVNTILTKTTKLCVYKLIDVIG